MRLDRARVADAVGLADGVGEQHDGLLATLGGLLQQVERALELAQVLGESGVLAEAQRQERPGQLQVVLAEQLADLAAAAEVAGRAELAARVAGVGDRLDERRALRQAGLPDGDLEDAVGDRCRSDARGHEARSTLIGRPS